MPLNRVILLLIYIKIDIDFNYYMGYNIISIDEYKGITCINTT